MKIIENGLPNEIYNIGSGEYLSNNEVAQKLLEVSNSPTSLIEYVKDRPGHDFRYATSFEKLKNLDGNQLTFLKVVSMKFIIGTRLIQTGFLDINNILKNREKGFEMIPIVIVHEDYNNFLKSSIEITGKNNKIYLIGNESVKQLDSHPSVTYIDIKKYTKLESLKQFQNEFVHEGDKDRRTYMFGS